MSAPGLATLLEIIRKELPGSTIEPHKKRVSLVHPSLSYIDFLTGKRRSRPKPLVALFDRPALEEVHVLCPPPVLSLLGYHKELSWEPSDRDQNQKVRWSFTEAKGNARRLGRQLGELLKMFEAGRGASATGA